LTLVIGWEPYQDCFNPVVSIFYIWINSNRVNYSHTSKFRPDCTQKIFMVLILIFILTTIIYGTYKYKKSMSRVTCKVISLNLILPKCTLCCCYLLSILMTLQVRFLFDYHILLCFMSINHAFFIYTCCDHRCLVRSTSSRSSWQTRGNKWKSVPTK